MKYLMTVIVAVICAVALVSSSVFADGCFMGKCNMTPKHGKAWAGKGQEGIFFHKAHLIMAKASELGLSDAQVQKIRDLEYNLKKSVIKKDADIKLLALDIRQALTKDDVDTNAVNGLIDQKYAIKAQKAKEDIQAYADLKNVLTPDQTKKLKEIWSKGMMKHGRHGKEGPSTPGPVHEEKGE